MMASNESEYHWINKNRESTSLTGATGPEATAVRKHVQRVAKGRPQVLEDNMVSYLSPRRGFSRVTAKGKNSRCDDDGKCKSNERKPKPRVACSKHHIRWRLVPSRGSNRSKAPHYRSTSGESSNEISMKLEPESSHNPSVAALPGAGRIDTSTYVTDKDLPEYGREVLDFAVNYFWPTFIPTRIDPQRHPVKAEWLSLCRESPMTFSVLLLAAAEAHFTMRGGVDSKPSNHLWRLTFHGAAIRHVNQYISTLGPTREPSDEILVCLLTLAVWAAENPKQRSKSGSALAHAQNLDGVSQRPHVQAHKDALYYLVKRKGGVQKIKVYGVGMLIQTIDIVWSTQDQRSPSLPWSQETPTIPFELASVPLYGENEDQRLASGFSRVPSIIASPTYVEVITAIQDLIIAIDTTEKTGTVAAYLPELVVMRNWIQHRLLSLPAAVNPTLRAGQPSPMDDVYVLEAVRLSLLILSSFIVFPQLHSDESQGLRTNAKLLEALDFCVSKASNGGATSLGAGDSAQSATMRLFAWAGMLGAMNCPADGWPAQRASFVAIVLLACRRLNLDPNQKHDWLGAKAALGVDELLWRSQELDELARGVWYDVSRLATRGSS